MTKQFEDEARLISLLAAGDRAAFEHVYREHNAALVRVGIGILRNRAVAEEVAQECWIAVLGNIAGFEGRSSLAGWIFTIMINKARTRAKREGRVVSFDDAGEEDSLAAAFDGRGRWRDMPELWEEITPERIVAGRSMLEHVNEAIDTLPAGQRAVLIMRSQQQLSSAEICAVLGIRESNLRVQLHRARLAVRARLDALL